MKNKWHKIGMIGTMLAATVLFGAESCDPEPSTAQKQAAARSEGVDRIREKQPVQSMDYSPTINTINRWAETWGQENKVAYVYMKRADGQFDGYYVLEGLPVNYCVGGSPPYDFERKDAGADTADVMVPAPGLDGAYYGGCDASRYYGFDAVTGQYIEYTDGMVLTAVLSDQPLPQQVPAYVSSIEDVKKK